jgi:precorrin-2/cobalt-factor-2 C20-methyltransferase
MAAHANATGSGTLYGVGLGPGAPDLVTPRAAGVIARCEVLAVPVKAKGAESFARAIARDLIRPDHQVLELIFPMRSDLGVLRPHWERAALRLSEHLTQGRDTAFLCEGDPLTYGTFVHVLGAVAKAFPEVPVRVVPGVSAYNAAAAVTCTPLAAADDRVAILPATYGVHEVDAMLDRFDTVVLLKPKPVMDPLVDLLEKRGLLPHAVFVSKVGTAEEEVERDLRKLRGRKLEYLSLVLVRNPHRVKEPVLRGCRPKGGAEAGTP